MLAGELALAGVEQLGLIDALTTWFDPDWLNEHPLLLGSQHRDLGHLLERAEAVLGQPADHHQASP